MGNYFLNYFAVIVYQIVTTLTNPNALTKRFLSEVERLINEGKAANYNDIATAIDWNRSGMSQVITGKRNIPYDVYKRFTDQYKLETIAEGEPPKYSKSDPLTALIESNRDLAESNKILAQSHADLVLLMRQSTAGESAEKLKADVSMFGAILEHLAKIGVRAGEWKSVDEALRAVGRTANDKNKGVQKVRS